MGTVAMGDLTEHFSRWEFACKCGCGFDTVDFATVIALEDVRVHFGARVDITSPCRCKPYNAYVGGAEDSQHPLARAEDFTVASVPAHEVQSYLHQRYPNMYGIGSYEDFTHLDTRTNGPARWTG